MKRKSIATYVLASVFLAAGIQLPANADGTGPQTTIDEATAAQIVRSLSITNQSDLNAILSANSVDELTDAQKAVLLQIVQLSAAQINATVKPIA